MDENLEPPADQLAEVVTVETQRTMIERLAAERRARERTPDGRFKEGVSGNLAGRPRSKHERAISSRQYRRDVLAVTEEPVRIKTSTGSKMVPFHVANLYALRAKASQGHGPSQRHLDKLHREAIAAHEAANPKLTRLVEAQEANAVNKSVDGLKNWEWRDLNLTRKFSWRV